MGEKITTQPEEITLALLEVVIMPNGELIHQGESLGWFDKMKDYLWEK